MTPQQWARVLHAGWNAPGLVGHAPPGDAIKIALRAMEVECHRIMEEDQ